MTNGVTVTLIEEYVRKHEQRMPRYVQFLQKPTADGTQENLLDRLEQLTYRTSMVSDISDETFGSATSGTALAFKLLPMSNLAAGYRKYKFGIVVTHDGRVFQYSAVTRPFLPDLLDGRVD